MRLVLYCLCWAHTAPIGEGQMLSFSITGRWDDLEDIDTVDKLKAHLCEVAGVEELSPKVEHPQTPASSVVYGSEKSQLEYGAPCYSLEDFEELSKAYAPLGLSGTYIVRGIDTASNNYPSWDEVSLDKQGNPLTIEVTSEMSAFDISVAMVKLSDSVFDGFPHHCYFESLDIDPVARTLTFSMGS
jgi:hypothetical protein